MRKNLLKFSLIQFIISAVVFIINYFFYHFVTDDGITLTFHEEAGKPFVADLIGQLGVLFLFSAIVSLTVAFIFFDKEDKNHKE